MKSSIKRLVFVGLMLVGLTGFLNATSVRQAHAQENPDQIDAGADSGKPQERWRSMSESEKKRIRENYRRWKDMSEEDRSDLKNRYQKFKTLPPEKKARLIEQHQRFKALPEDKQQRIRENFQRFRKLPSSERSRRLEGLRARRQSRLQEGDPGGPRREMRQPPQRRRQQ